MNPPDTHGEQPNTLYVAVGAFGETGFQYTNVSGGSNPLTAHTHTIAAEGGSQAHNNVQPSLALLYCVKQ